MKIVVLDGYALNPGDLSWKGIEDFGDLTVYDRSSYDPKDEDIILERAKDADIILTNKTPLTKNVISNMPNLKYIGVLATGYDVVDIDAAKERGVVVTNIPSYGTTAVAQMTFALILELTNHVGEHNRAVHDGQWERSQDWSFTKHPLMELAGKTIGIIGYGRIGQNVGEIAQAFGMKVLANAKTPREELENEMVKFADLDSLLRDSDIISLHCPLTEDTEEMINKDSISLMKDSALLINTSRGGLINENDLAMALNEGKIAGAALDVVSVEPILSDNPLLKAKNTIITPHISWAPRESRLRLMNIAVENLRSFLEGKISNQV